MRPAAAGAITSAALFIVYTLTLAPGVTFWDAGELLAAVESLGIPHPPGTPLWVLIARAWSDLLGFLPRAAATNLLSAAAVSAATGVLAALIAQWSGRWLAGIAAGLAAGLMSTVWLNATETEAYAIVLLLGALMLLAGERAGSTGHWRWMLLLAYLMALAVPVHLAALVAAPAAIVLAVQPVASGARIRWRSGALLVALLFAVAGVGTVSPTMMIVSVCLLIAGVMSSERPPAALLVVLVAMLALSALAFLPIRAAHEPWLNTQDPVDWGAFWDLIGRRQYGEQPLWPRRAPLWAQFGMLMQYAEWQVALGVTPGIVPSVPRVFAAVLFVVLAIVGARWHHALDRRSWLGMLVLLLCGTVALVIYMNFRAGPTFGHGLLPADAGHEARERDYFFLVGFWSWGAWAGLGAVRATMRLPRGAGAAGLALAALPLALNWRGVDRRAEPDASLPVIVARALLGPLPEHAVLITIGDNDTYPSWYLQAVGGERRDVTVIVSPMLNAAWYRAELVRRHALLDEELASHPMTGELLALVEIARRAAELGRPLRIASTMEQARLRMLARDWTLTGLHYEQRQGDVYLERLGIWADTASLAAAAQALPVYPLLPPGTTTDPTVRLMSAWLACPRQVLLLARGALPVDSLATVCKL